MRRHGLLTAAGLILAFFLLVLSLFIWGGSEEVPGDVHAVSSDAPGGAIDLVSADVAGERPGALGDSPRSTVPASAPRFGSIVGKVVHEEDGSPAPDVGVRIIPREHSGGRQSGLHLVTDVEGEFFHGELRPGLHLVKTDRSTSASAVVVRGKTVHVDIEVSRGLHVVGTVLDSADAPVSGADVWLSDPGNQDHTRVVTQSDAQGCFDIRCAAPQLLIGARKAGFAPSGSKQLSPGGTNSKPYRVELRLTAPGGTIEGVVLRSDGSPVENARVRAALGRRLYQGWGGFSPAAVQAHSDRDGAFLLEGVAPGWVSLQALAEGHAPWHREVRVLPHGRSTVEIRLVEGATVFGCVRTSTGEALPGARVVADDGPDRTVEVRLN